MGWNVYITFKKYKNTEQPKKSYCSVVKGDNQDELQVLFGVKCRGWMFDPCLDNILKVADFVDVPIKKLRNMFNVLDKRVAFMKSITIETPFYRKEPTPSIINYGETVIDELKQLLNYTHRIVIERDGIIESKYESTVEFAKILDRYVFPQKESSYTDDSCRCEYRVNYDTAITLDGMQFKHCKLNNKPRVFFGVI